jgi:hypothetical protein
VVEKETRGSRNSRHSETQYTRTELRTFLPDCAPFFLPAHSTSCLRSVHPAPTVATRLRRPLFRAPSRPPTLRTIKNTAKVSGSDPNANTAESQPFVTPPHPPLQLVLDASPTCLPPPHIIRDNTSTHAAVQALFMCYANQSRCPALILLGKHALAVLKPPLMYPFQANTPKSAGSFVIASSESLVRLANARIIIFGTKMAAALALPSASSCASFDLTVRPYLPQLYSLPIALQRVTNSNAVAWLGGQ